MNSSRDVLKVHRRTSFGSFVETSASSHLRKVSNDGSATRKWLNTMNT